MQLGGREERDGIWVRRTPFAKVTYAGERLPLEARWFEVGVADGATVSVFCDPDAPESGWKLDRDEMEPTYALDYKAALGSSSNGNPQADTTADSTANSTAAHLQGNSTASS